MGLQAYRGHADGFACVRKLWPYAQKMGIRFLTLWAFSTENWKRSPVEVEVIMTLLEKALKQVSVEMHEKKARFVVIGRRDRLKPAIVSLIEHIERETMQYESFCVTVAIDYGGRDEIRRASEKLRSSGDPSLQIEDFLDTTLAKVPNPDLIIRTGKEQRLSGFMPLQSEYAELYFTDVLFPQFTTVQFQGALNEYVRRKRNFGA